MWITFKSDISTIMGERNIFNKKVHYTVVLFSVCKTCWWVAMQSFVQIHYLFAQVALKFRALMTQMMIWKTDTLSDAFTTRVRLRGEKCCWSHPHLIVLLQDGGCSANALCTSYNCHFRLIQSSAALRPHLLLRMSDRTAATYDQTLLSLCTCDSSLREAVMCCQQCSPLSCLDLPSSSVSFKHLLQMNRRKVAC